MNPKRIIKHTINKLGYDIRPIEKSAIRTSVKQSYDLIRSLGFYPATVIDIGVASGTPALYTSFPDAYFLLVEPLKEFEQALVSIIDRYKGTYVLAAAGSRPGEVTFNVHSDLDGSSMLKETMGAEADGHEITVPVIRIDDVLKERNLRGPYFIKADVQGAELEALAGAEQALTETEVVQLEVSLFGFMKGGPQFYDVICWMKAKGFVAYDIIQGWNRPLDHALGQVDIMFVRDDGMFRRDHSYATIEQLREILRKRQSAK